METALYNPEEDPQRKWKGSIEDFNRGCGYEDELSKARYRIRLSDEYSRLYQQAKDNRSFASYVGELYLNRFPLITRFVKEIDLDRASTTDIGLLVAYFGYRGKSLEEITDNVTREMI